MFSFIKNIGTTEWILIALILVVFFGAKTVVKMSKISGEALKEVKNIKKGITKMIEGPESGEPTNSEREVKE